MTTKAEKSDMVSLLADTFIAKRLQPGEFTVRMFMDLVKAKGQDITHVQAERHLGKEAAEGRIVVRHGIVNGRSGKIYREK